MSEFPAIASKIERLFAKAANTTNPHERDAFVAKAEALAAKHSITSAMLAAAAPVERSAPEKRTIKLPSKYSQQHGQLAYVIGKAFGVESVLTRRSDGKRGYGHMVGVGFPEDLDAVQMLFEKLSLMLVKEMSQPGSKSYKITMAQAFAARVSSRLMNEMRQAKEEAEREAQEASATEATGEPKATNVPGVGIVLADRKAATQAEFKSQFPRTRTIRSKSTFSSGGYNKGQNLADRADLGTRKRIGA